MLLRIGHLTRYRYSRPVTLSPQVLRLRPREEACQRLVQFSTWIRPDHREAPLLDPEGNSCLRIWFDKPVSLLEVRSESVVETRRPDPFGFLLEPWATRLPWKGLPERTRSLAAFLPRPGRKDSEACRKALQTALSPGGSMDTVAGLSRLNQWVFRNLRRVRRPEGGALPPWKTLQAGEGSCRDLALLFMGLAQGLGVPARFVSGYFLEHPERRQHDLHAWAELFFPGAGWKGYDPSCGLACGDQHVALCASHDPGQTLPVEGSFQGQAKAELEALVEIRGE
jgi:transglutaminase-like putative cysteine protease